MCLGGAIFPFLNKVASEVYPKVSGTERKALLQWVYMKSIGCCRSQSHPLISGPENEQSG